MDKYENQEHQLLNEEQISFRRVYREFLLETLGENYDQNDLETKLDNRYKNFNKDLNLLKSVTDIFEEKYYDKVKGKICIPKSEIENVITLLKLLCTKSSVRKGLQEVKKDRTIMKGELNYFITRILSAIKGKIDNDIFEDIAKYNQANINKLVEEDNKKYLRLVLEESVAAILDIKHEQLMCTSMYVYTGMLKEVFQKWVALVNVAMYVQNRTLHDIRFYRQLTMEVKMTDDLRKTSLQNVLVLTGCIEKWEKDILDIQSSFKCNWNSHFEEDENNVLDQIDILMNMTLGMGKLHEVLQEILEEVILEYNKAFEEYLEILVAINSFDERAIDEYMKKQD